MKNTIKVLLVEDHAFQRAFLKEMLHQVGFCKVDTAESAQDALAMTKASVYQLIVTDLSMPGMDGIQFIYELAKLRNGSLLAIMSSSPPPMIDSVSLMAKEVGLTVVGAFNKPITHQNIVELAAKFDTSRSLVTGSKAVHSKKPRFALDELVGALENHQIQAWFQPKKSLDTGKIVGAEALARWHHNELGVLLPGAFLAEIYEYRLEHALLLRILEDVLAAQRIWRRDCVNVPVSVNLPIQLLQLPELPDDLFQLASDRGASPADICFELLEDVETTVPGRYYMGACRLRLKGFGLAQDDFGKGYSSIYNLISTPFTEVKIDRSLVHGVAGNEMLAAALIATIRLGKQLGLQVTAEGVETAEDLQFLRHAGCDLVQGFVVSAAVEEPALRRLLHGDAGAEGFR